MTSPLSSSLFAVLLFSLTAACAAPIGSDQSPEETALLSGKLDGFGVPIEHGRVLPNSSDEGVILDDSFVHAWDFSLSGPARVEAVTGPGPRGRPVDTLLRIQRGRGGAPIIDNDNASDTTTFSHAKTDLDAGSYRVIVTGAYTDVKGPFTLRLRCTGPGCEGGAAVLRVPLMAASTGRPVSESNEQVVASGLDAFPDSVVISGDAAGLGKFAAWTEYAEEATAVVGTDLRLISHADPQAYEGLCYEGDAMDVSRALEGLVAGVFPDTLVVWGVHHGGVASYADGFTAANAEQAFPAAFFEANDTGSVVVVTSTDEAGRDLRATVIAVCPEAASR